MGLRSHVLRDPDIAADDRAAADGDAAQNGGAGIDHHVVLHDGVARPAFLQMALGIARKALGAQRDGLINAHIAADNRRLANHHARAVIDKAARANACAGVNVYARKPMGQLGGHARQQRQLQPVQNMGDAVVNQGQHAGVAEHDFIHALRRRVAVIGGQHIDIEQFAQQGQLLCKLAHRLYGAHIQPLHVFARAVLAGAVTQLDTGLRQQRLQGGVQRVGDVEILARLAQLRWPQTQRIEHALERLDGLLYRLARGKFTLRRIGTPLLLTPQLTHLAQLADDLGNGKITHDVVLF